ncbi:alpha-1,2-fucosyltransferase [Methanospirillum sp.]
MIIVRLIGGLGNQMFQYAFGRHLAVHNNCQLKLDLSGFDNYTLRNYDLHHFNIEEHIANPDDLSGVLLPSDWFFQRMQKQLGILLGRVLQIKYVKEQIIDFIPEMLTLGDNIYLDGYWQSEKYFSDIKDIIKQEFTFKKKPDKMNASYIDEISNCVSVSVHIRRGDYVSDQRTNQTHGFLGLDYYNKGIRKMVHELEEPHFYVFSDDIKWAEQYLKADVPIHFIKHNGSNNYEDLRLMSRCKHHIIANSSFSWWGAWLGKKDGQIVIAPNRWFTLKEKHNMDDRIPDRWLRMK